MKKLLIPFIPILFTLILLIGCERNTLLTEYSGYVTMNSNLTINLPYIKGGNNYKYEIKCFYSDSTSSTWYEIPQIWTAIAYKRVWQIDWDIGTICLYKMQKGDKYIIQIFY